MSKYLSDKLTILSTILIIMVIYVHSCYQEAEQYSTALFLQKLTSNICSIANCLFFCISGYLFAYSIQQFNDIYFKLQKRLYTLLLPYIFWNIIFVLWYVMLDIIPGMEQWVNNPDMIGQLLNRSISEILHFLFIKPVAFQLWFLRDLLIMMALSPLLWSWAKRNWQSAVIAAFCLTCWNEWLIYFWIGIIFAIQKWNIENFLHSRWLILGSCFISIGYAIFYALNNSLPQFLEAIVNFIRLYAVWSIYDVFAQKRLLASKKPWKYLCGYSFFIYCFHEPAFNVIKKLSIAYLGCTEYTLILFYFINPLIMVGVAIIVAKLLQKVFPSGYKILTGGR